MTFTFSEAPVGFDDSRHHGGRAARCGGLARQDARRPADLDGDVHGRRRLRRHRLGDGDSGSYTDAAGNAGVGGPTRSTIDRVNPTVTVDIVDAALSDGDNSSLVTFTFSEAPVGFGDADVTVVGGTVTGGWIGRAIRRA